LIFCEPLGKPCASHAGHTLDLEDRLERFAAARFNCKLGDTQSIDINIIETAIFNWRGGSVLQAIVIAHAAIFD
jgi:hypothetical protein